MRVFLGFPEVDIQSLLMPRLEELGYQVLYLTSDALSMNLDSLVTCNLVVVNQNTPFWVLREADEHHLPVVCFETCPNFQDTAPSIADTGLCLALHDKDLVVIAKTLLPHVGDLVPVTDEYIEIIASLKVQYPCSIEWKVHNE